MKLLLLSFVLAEAQEVLSKILVEHGKALTSSEDGLLCYQCDAAKENGEITRGDEACFVPKEPNNLTVRNAGPNGTCISIYWETTTSDGNKRTSIERRFYDERADTNQGVTKIVTYSLNMVRRTFSDLYCIGYTLEP